MAPFHQVQLKAVEANTVESVLLHICSDVNVPAPPDVPVATPPAPEPVAVPVPPLTEPELPEPPDATPPAPEPVAVPVPPAALPGLDTDAALTTYDSNPACGEVPPNVHPIEAAAPNVYAAREYLVAESCAVRAVAPATGVILGLVPDVIVRTLSNAPSLAEVSVELTGDEANALL